MLFIMVRIYLVVFVLVGLAGARTLDGRVKGIIDRGEPHGLDEGYSSGNVDLTECKGCGKTPEHIEHNQDVTKEYVKDTVKNNNRRNHNKRGGRNRKSKNPKDKILPFLSFGEIKVSVTNNKRESRRKHFRNNHRNGASLKKEVKLESDRAISHKPRADINHNQDGDNVEVKPNKDVTVSKFDENENENLKHFLQNKDNERKSHKDKNLSDSYKGLMKIENENNYKIDRHSVESKKESQTRKDTPNKRTDKPIDKQSENLVKPSKDNKNNNDFGEQSIAITDSKKDIKKSSDTNKQENEKQNKNRNRKIKRKKNNKQAIKSQEGKKKKSTKGKDKPINNSKNANKENKVQHKEPSIDEGYTKDLDIAAAPPDDLSDDRWSRRGLDQVPDVERLERRLHPKVEAPVDDIIRTLQKVLGDVRNSIFQAEYNYKHTFNTTRWGIMVGVREELMNIAKENDNVYDAVMEVSLHTKELYLRAHQRRKFSHPQALTAPDTNGMRDVDLRSKYTYARDEMRSAELLKRKIMGLQRKRSSLRYDYMELTRKILEKLPNRELYDLGRRANQTIQTLEYSKAMRDSINRAHLYRHSQTSTFLDMRSARNHINDASDILAAVKQQYSGNHEKAKEIQRARQQRRPITTMDFEMFRMEQWAMVDNAKSHSDDLFHTAAIILMKLKPLLAEGKSLITAIRNGTQESKFERTLRNIRETIPMLNFTIFAIKSHVCTDEYEACIVKLEEISETDIDGEIDTELDKSEEDKNVIDETVEESSGETTDEGDTNLVEENSGFSDTEDIDESSGYFIEIEGDEMNTTTTIAPTTTGKPSTAQNSTKKISIELADTDDEDILEEIKRAGMASAQSPKPISTTHPPKLSKSSTERPQEPTTKLFVNTTKPDQPTTTTKPTKARVTTKIPIIGLSDSDDEDIIAEIEKAMSTTESPTENTESTTTAIETTTKPTTKKSSGWGWDLFGFQNDGVFDWYTRHKRDVQSGYDNLLNVTLTELIQEHLRNRTEVNEEWLDKGKLRQKSVNDLQNYFDRIKRQINTFENKTLKVKSFLSRWRAKRIEYSTVHDRVVDVSKDINFKFEVLMEQNGKAVKQAEAKLKRMQEAYENNKDRINDDKSPETAKQAIELAQKANDNLIEIVSLKKLNAAPCKKLQTMDTMIRANISELQHKIKQAKLIAASLQVAVQMEGKSHLEVPILNVDTNKQAEMEVEMTVKTYSDSGAIATVQTNNTGAIVISMDDFYPKLTVLDSGIYNIEENTGDAPLNNDTWYKFKLERFATDYNLTVYNGSSSVVQSFITKVNKDYYPTVYNHPSAVYIGGAREDFELDSWSGCIGNIKVNNEYLNLLKSGSDNKVPKSCTVLSTNTEDRRNLILDGFSHAFYTLDRRQNPRLLSFSIIFTPQSDGMVFTLNAENKRYKVAAMIKKRMLLVSTQVDNTPTKTVSYKDVFGIQVNLEISVKGRAYIIKVNNGDTSGPETFTETLEIVKLPDDGVHIGATSNTSRSIRGCIHSMTINTEDVPVYSMLDATSVTYGSCKPTACVTFSNTSMAVQLPNITLSDSVAVVFTYGSSGPVLQYSRGKKFNLTITVNGNSIDLKESVKDKTGNLDLSDYNFNAGDDVVLMVTDADKTLTISVGDESEEISYEEGGLFDWWTSDDDDDEDDDNGLYDVTVGGTNDPSTDTTMFVGNVVTLKQQGRTIELSKYSETHSLRRCSFQRNQRQNNQPLPPRKQRTLTC